MSIMNYIVAFVLGVVAYFAYPVLFSEEKGLLKQLVYTSETVEKVEPDSTAVTSDQKTENSVVDSNSKSQNGSSNFSLNQIIPSDYPKSCTIVQATKVTIEDGTEVKLAIGDRVTPVAFENKNLTVTIEKLGNSKANIRVKNTNFLGSATARAYKRLGLDVDSITNTKVGKINTKKKDTKKKGTKEMVADSNQALSEADVKELVTTGFNSLITLQGSKVRTVKAVGDESIEGVEYQVGEVFFEKETLIGTRRLTAKALISNGSIVKWVWLESNQEIK